MSAQPNVRGAAPAYDDAEKGTHDAPRPVQPAFPSEEKKDPFVNDEKTAVAVAAFELPSSKETPAPAAKPAPKPKKKVSKWIVWTLWFNTYRSDFIETYYPWTYH